jgi:hypothetical protein
MINLKNNKKTLYLLIAAFASISILTIIAFAVSNNSFRLQPNSTDQQYYDAETAGDILPNTNTLTVTAITEKEVAGLLLMREEEKLARDIYNALYEKWGIAVFANIAKSENSHTLAVESVLNAYNIADPVTDDSYTSAGKYTNVTLTELYKTLLEKGNKSIKDAIEVGLTVEDLDISDLKSLLAETKNTSIINVYNNLEKGSRNHLRAFNNQAKSSGLTYLPKYISQEEFNSIVNGSIEKGGRQTQGNMQRGRNNRRTY